MLEVEVVLVEVLELQEQAVQVEVVQEINVLLEQQEQ
jgi:hypothetical protein